MNQAVSFGLLFAGGISLTSALTGSSLSEVTKGNPGTVKNTGSTLAGIANNGVSGAGSAVASGVGGAVSGAAAAAGGYVNPFAGSTGLVKGRIDMGQDFNLTPGQPINAIGNSKVLNVQPNWYSGQPAVWLQFLDGVDAGKIWYVAEQIIPSVKAGDTVAAGQPVGHYAASGTGLELGFGAPNDQTLAQAQGNTGGAGHSSSPAGQAFHNFLVGLGL
jgi:hypothetical protein